MSGKNPQELGAVYWWDASSGLSGTTWEDKIASTIIQFSSTVSTDSNAAGTYVNIPSGVGGATLDALSSSIKSLFDSTFSVLIIAEIVGSPGERDTAVAIGVPSSYKFGLGVHGTGDSHIRWSYGNNSTSIESFNPPSARLELTGLFFAAIHESGQGRCMGVNPYFLDGRSSNSEARFRTYRTQAARQVDNDGLVHKIFINQNQNFNLKIHHIAVFDKFVNEYELHNVQEWFGKSPASIHPSNLLAWYDASYPGSVTGENATLSWSPRASFLGSPPALTAEYNNGHPVKAVTWNDSTVVEVTGTSDLVTSAWGELGTAFANSLTVLSDCLFQDTNLESGTRIYGAGVGHESASGASDSMLYVDGAFDYWKTKLWNRVSGQCLSTAQNYDSIINRGGYGVDGLHYFNKHHASGMATLNSTKLCHYDLKGRFESVPYGSFGTISGNVRFGFCKFWNSQNGNSPPLANNLAYARNLALWNIVLQPTEVTAALCWLESSFGKRGPNEIGSCTVWLDAEKITATSLLNNPTGGRDSSIVIDSPIPTTQANDLHGNTKLEFPNTSDSTYPLPGRSSAKRNATAKTIASGKNFTVFVRGEPGLDVHLSETADPNQGILTCRPNIGILWYGNLGSFGNDSNGYSLYSPVEENSISWFPNISSTSSQHTISACYTYKGLDSYPSHLFMWNELQFHGVWYQRMRGTIHSATHQDYLWIGVRNVDNMSSFNGCALELVLVFDKTLDPFTVKSLDRWSYAYISEYINARGLRFGFHPGFNPGFFSGLINNPTI